LASGDIFDVIVADWEVADWEVADWEVSGGEVAGGEVSGGEVAGWEVAGWEVAGWEVAGSTTGIDDACVGEAATDFNFKDTFDSMFCMLSFSIFILALFASMI
jgi:hypothetical protein